MPSIGLETIILSRTEVIHQDPAKESKVNKGTDSIPTEPRKEWSEV
jgi:hypothetical protein